MIEFEPLDPALLRPGDNGFVCPKCGVASGDAWSECGRYCPIEGSPKYNATTARKYKLRPDNEHPKGPVEPGKFFVWVTETQVIRYHVLCVEAADRDAAYETGCQLVREGQYKAAVIENRKVTVKPMPMRRDHFERRGDEVVEKQFDRPRGRVNAGAYIGRYLHELEAPGNDPGRPVPDNDGSEDSGPD